MIFGETRIDEAEGLILAHSLRLPKAMLKKGRVLTADDVRAIKDCAINFVTGARLEDGDMGENEAAQVLAAALSGSGIIAKPAFSGRVILLADQRGLAVIDRDRLDRLNRVDEAVAVATLTPFDIVAPRQIVATIKIIPFGLNRRIIEAAAAVAATGEPLIQVRPFRPLKVAVILSTLPGLRPATLDATAAVTRARVASLGGTVEWEQRCNHDVGALERGVTRMVAAGAEMVLILGASATVDRRDVVPAAILRAGGVIDLFGMPVDPGNLILLAHLGAIPVVNLPGCARSAKLNGVDWVLRRLAAGVTIKPVDIMRMGGGGMLKELPSHEIFAASPREPRIAAVVLAAGASRRMGEDNKLLVEIAGRPMAAHTAETALSAALDPVVVVTGHQADEVEETLPTCDVLAVRNPDYALGMASSIACGLAALPEDVDAAFIMLADMPRINESHLTRLKAAFDPDEGRAICVPVYRQRRGNPVLFAREFFDEIQSLTGDHGARQLLTDYAERVFEVVMEDDSVLADVDTVGDLEQVR
jgi:molybdenum cofactor cytidylyltransferase